MEHIRLIKKPSLTMYPGIVVDESTAFEYRTEHLEQTLENLVFHTVRKVSGDNYTGTYDTTIYLKSGDILVYDGEDHGYVKPVESFVTIADAAEELACVKDLR